MIERYRPTIRAVAREMLGDALQYLDDVEQDVVLRLLQSAAPLGRASWDGPYVRTCIQQAAVESVRRFERSPVPVDMHRRC